MKSRFRLWEMQNFITVSCAIALYEGYSEEKLITGLTDYRLI